jgi:TonB family protein
MLSEAERKALTPITIPEGYLRRCARYPVRPLPGPSVSGHYEVCVHPEGFVYDVRVRRSSGVPGLDERLAEATRVWVYDPEVRDGRAVAFCHQLVVVWRAAASPSAH